MPLLTGGTYPTFVAAKQKELLGKKGYHVVFDTPCNLRHWEKRLPCSVEAGFTVSAFVRILPFSGTSFRYCVNFYGRSQYVEIGEFFERGGRTVTCRVNNKDRGYLPHSQTPNIGDVLFITFTFTGDNMFMAYFNDHYIATVKTVYSELQYFYMHGPPYNFSELLSLHFTRTDGKSILNGNLPDTNVGFTLPTSTLYVRGKYTGKQNDKKIRFETHEYLNPWATRTTFELDPGKKKPDTMKIEILSFLVVVTLGDGRVVAVTKALGGDYKKPCIVSVEKNFSVDSVTIVSTRAFAVALDISVMESAERF